MSTRDEPLRRWAREASYRIKKLEHRVYQEEDTWGENNLRLLQREREIATAIRINSSRGPFTRGPNPCACGRDHLVVFVTQPGGEQVTMCPITYWVLRALDNLENLEEFMEETPMEGFLCA